jgi:hypothetical protein
MANKDISTLRENVSEFLCDTFSSFEVVNKLVGETKQTAVVDKDLFRDFVPADRLVGRMLTITWEYFSCNNLVTLGMYKFEGDSDAWHVTKKVTRQAYGYKWPDTVELRDLLITFVAGGEL